jgi:hypothetical protein
MLGFLYLRDAIRLSMMGMITTSFDPPTAPAGRTDNRRRIATVSEALPSCPDCELPPHRCCCKERAAYLERFRKDREQVTREWERKLSCEVPATDMGEQHPVVTAIRDQLAMLKDEVARQMYNEFMARSHPPVRPWKRT